MSSTRTGHSRQWFRSLRGWLQGCCLGGLVLVLPAQADVSVVGTTAQSRAVVAAQDAQALAADAAQLAALQQYIGETYRVPLQAVQAVVASAWEVGQTRQLDPLLLLAVMAIESSFNPKAKSPKGAQGLMQVMTRIHHERFEPHGGLKVALKPAVNIDVGAQILQECIDRRGSIAGGLTCYVGAPGVESRYGNRVLAEFEKLQAIVAEELPAAAPEAGPSFASEDHVIHAPPISRLAEADAPRLARALLETPEGLNL